MAIVHLTPEILDPKPVRYQTLERMAESLGLDRHLIQQIFGISPRKQARLHKSNGILNPLVVARLNRFNRIMQQASGLFEDTHKAIEWLQTPKLNLAGNTPLAALCSDRGAKQIEEILYRAEYGIYG